MFEIKMNIKNCNYCFMYGHESFIRTIRLFFYKEYEYYNYHILYVDQSTFDELAAVGIDFHHLNLTKEMFKSISDEDYKNNVDNDHIIGTFDDIFIPSNCSIELSGGYPTFIKIIDEFPDIDYQAVISTKDEDLATMVRMAL